VLGFRDDAQTLYKHVLFLEPANALAHAGLGMMLLGTGKWRSEYCLWEWCLKGYYAIEYTKGFAFYLIMYSVDCAVCRRLYDCLLHSDSSLLLFLLLSLRLSILLSLLLSILLSLLLSLLLFLLLSLLLFLLLSLLPSLLLVLLSIVQGVAVSLL
jgi:hypothetical protein